MNLARLSSQRWCRREVADTGLDAIALDDLRRLGEPDLRLSAAAR